MMLQCPCKSSTVLQSSRPMTVPPLQHAGSTYVQCRNKADMNLDRCRGMNLAATTRTPAAEGLIDRPIMAVQAGNVLVCPLPGSALVSSHRINGCSWGRQLMLQCGAGSSELRAKPVSQDAGGMVQSGEAFGSSTGTSSVPSSVASDTMNRNPKRSQRSSLAEHLLVLVHGINAGPKDWDDVTEVLQSELGSRFMIHASSANPTFQTFVGVDLAGKRLADEVWQIVRTKPGLKRISFVAHSLGGLFQRYAIASLYNPKNSTIAGLEPVQFVTIATPHLGMRGSKSLPMAFGMPVLEELAAIFTVGRTARQLFLTDGEPNESPLLLRMATDCSEGRFISALRAFNSRVTYANVTFDQMVGWRTASIRREVELTTPPNRSLDGYRHIVSETFCPAVESTEPKFQPGTAKKKAIAQIAPRSSLRVSYHETVEEEMIRGLQQVSWNKVDMNFHSATIPFLAHNHFHVKYVWPVQFEGAGLISHIKDSIKRLELENRMDIALRKD